MFVLRAFQTDSSPVSCERWRFSHLPIRIGRNPLNDFSPQHPAISGFHARIEDSGGKLCICDLGSTNGVFLPKAAGDGIMRISANASTDLAPAGFRFYLSESVWVQLEIVQEEAPLRDRGSGNADKVLGNVAMIAQPGQQSPTPPPVPAAAPQGRALPTDVAPRPGPAPAVPRPTGYPPAPWDPPGPEAPAPLPGSSQAGAGPGVPRRSSHDEPPKSQFFDVQLDFLALQGLRELARSLIPDRTLETTGDVARLITKLHDTVDVFCRCFVPLRQGYEQFVSSLDLAAKRSINLSPSAATLEAATTPEAVAVALLDPRDLSSDAPKAVEAILADLARHQVALLDGVMQGVRALLDELSPEKIEAALGQRGTADLFGAKYRARWIEFCERYQRLSDEREAFTVIFGQDFTEVYRQYWRREYTKDRGARTGPPQG